jgi:hypothetical protein
MTMEAEPILKKTLMTMAAMVGAWVAFVGTVTVVAVLVTSHAVATPDDGKDAPAAASGPAAKSDATHLPNAPAPPSRSHQSI